jgi:dTDP-4-dehydrorhamnose reductase/SAM-dependent methyltransferase
MKILLIGGSGLLGTELQKLNADMRAPDHQALDITDQNQLAAFIAKGWIPEVIINAAAVTDNMQVEKNPMGAIAVNIIGAANVAWLAYETGARLVYLSTDYVYKGDRGNYKETDEILPFNLYSWTKLGGECSAVAVKNHLIIRTSFGTNIFSYPEAFTDKWASKDYIDVIAPMIYEAALSPLTGVLNLGTERKSLFEYARARNETVRPVKLVDTNFFTPADTSLNLQRWIDYKADKSIARPHTNCRVCGSDKLLKYLDLGLMPLANNLEFTAPRAKAKERFPLQVLFCEECGLSQLSVVIDPEKMFSYYTYRSSVNGGYVKHCREMARSLKEKHGLTADSLHVDIAGNDGALLKEFRDEIGLRVVNVDPATNLVAIAEAQGIESYADFWSLDVVKRIADKHGQADLITATNVFAHVDDVRQFILSAKALLKPAGVLVIEFPYLVDFIENMEFDTVYFEHLSYFSITPLVALCEKFGMVVIDAEKQDIHGGTMRVTIAAETPENKSLLTSVSAHLTEENFNGFTSTRRYAEWSASVNDVVSSFAGKLLALKKSGHKIAGFAASAKGNTLLNCAGINTDIMNFIADETPEKIGKFSPGTGIPIVNKQQIVKTPPDYIVILSWNFAEEIIAKLRPIYSGKFIIPIPAFEIIV